VWQVFRLILGWAAQANLDELLGDDDAVDRLLDKFAGICGRSVETLSGLLQVVPEGCKYEPFNLFRRYARYGAGRSLPAFARGHGKRRTDTALPACWHG
jgi:hypothetical protein